LILFRDARLLTARHVVSTIKQRIGTFWIGGPEKRDSHVRRVIFDLDVMRSFVAGVDLGSFAKASARVGRSTSAVSAQLKKLEEQAGTPIFRKEGRGLALTEAGETLLSYARRLLDLNDEAASAVRNLDLDGLGRVDIPAVFSL